MTMNRILAKSLALGLSVISGLVTLQAQETATSAFERLDKWAEECNEQRSLTLGYPGNNDI